MTVRVESRVAVNRPIEEACAFLTDPFNRPRVRSGWLGAFQTSPGPMGVGSTFRGRVGILGGEKSIVCEVTQWDPPQRVAVSFSGGGMGSGNLRAALEASADGTKVVRVSELNPGPRLKMLWWIIGPWIKHKMVAADRNLKRLLESGAGPRTKESIDAR